MAVLTKTVLFNGAEAEKQHLKLRLSALTQANGDTFDVPLRAENVSFNKVGVSGAIANNTPAIGSSRITVSGGTIADVLTADIYGRM
jgi:hypothetical protein